jgi:hypothetical protein
MLAARSGAADECDATIVAQNITAGHPNKKPRQSGVSIVSTECVITEFQHQHQLLSVC